jgi:hypothetical protein
VCWKVFVVVGWSSARQQRHPSNRYPSHRRSFIRDEAYEVPLSRPVNRRARCWTNLFEPSCGSLAEELKYYERPTKNRHLLQYSNWSIARTLTKAQRGHSQRFHPCVRQRLWASAPITICKLKSPNLCTCSQVYTLQYLCRRELAGKTSGALG